MAIECKFYNVPSDRNKIGKNLDTLTATTSIVLKDGCSILNPTIIVKMENYIFNSNYFHLGNELLTGNVFNRYYFISDLRIIEGMAYVDGEVDVLETYKNEILSKKCVVTRQQHKYFADGQGIFYDCLYPVRSDVQVTTMKIGVCTNGAGYYLTTNGG